MCITTIRFTYVQCLLNAWGTSAGAHLVAMCTVIGPYMQDGMPGQCASPQSGPPVTNLQCLATGPALQSVSHQPQDEAH